MLRAALCLSLQNDALIRKLEVSLLLHQSPSTTVRGEGMPCFKADAFRPASTNIIFPVVVVVVMVMPGLLFPIGRFLQARHLRWQGDTCESALVAIEGNGREEVKR